MKSKMPAFVRWLAALAATVLTLLLMVFAALVLLPTERLVQTLLQQELEDAGIVLVKLELERVGLTQTHIALVELQLPAQAMQLRTENLTASYTLSDLRQGQLDKLAVTRMQLWLEADDDATDSVTSWQDDLQTALAALPIFGALPFDALTIDQLDFYQRAGEDQITHVQLANLSLAINAEDSALSADLLALDDLFLPIPIAINAEVSAAEAGVQLDLQLSASALSLDGLARQMLDDWPAQLQLVSGMFELQLQAHSNSTGDTQPHTGQLTSQLMGQISMTGVGGQFGELVFSGLESVFALTLATELAPALDDTLILNTEQLHIDALDIGLPVTRINTGLALTWAQQQQPVLVLLKPSAQLLGGSLSENSIRIDCNQSAQQFAIGFSQIDLAQVVTLHQVDGLAANGRVRGRLPLRWDARGLRLDNGTLSAHAPGGVIRYQPGTGGALLDGSSEQGSILLKALEHFQYDALDASMHYRPDGQLTLALAFQGKNIEQFGEKPIHFNLNLEQNLLALLSSLRAAQGLSDSIDAAVQRFYQDRNPSWADQE